MKLLSKAIPAYTLVVTVILAGTLLLYQGLHPVKVIEKIESRNNCEIQLIRSTSFKFIGPLMLADRVSEDENFSGLKSSLNDYFNSEKTNGNLTSASIFVREFEKGKWFAINPNETFSPGSMMKIVSLISYLKDSERNPELLNQKIQFKAHFSELPTQKIAADNLIQGKYYTIKELLEEMIIYSNNDATVLLNSSMNFNTYFDVLNSINLTIPKKDQPDYPMTTIECSRLLRIIFNSSYLNSTNSEYAMDLLTKSKFHDGLAKLIPENVTIAHKFGERFNPVEQQLHETAIIYSNNKPYLLTVMTRGKDQEKLKNILNLVGKKVYDFMAIR